MEFIDLATQLSSMRTAIDKRIAKVLNHGKFIMGPEVVELEEQLADYVGVKHCITCANGTDALQMALMSYNIGEGDIVFTTSFSFFATAEVISLVGATPCFVDIDPSTFNIDPRDLERAIQEVELNPSGKPRAVITVDLFGLPADYPKLRAICENYDLKLIEDAAQGFGGAIGNKLAASFGDVATTSFFPAKPLGCFGDGGALFTQDDEVAEALRSIRVHGKGSHKYENVRIGLNSRLDTIQAAILLEKLAHFPQELEARNRVSELYQQIENKIELPRVPNNFSSSWAQFTVKVEPEMRDRVQKYLSDKGVPTAIYYDTPLNMQTAFSRYKNRTTPIAEDTSKRVFSLPMSGYLTTQDANKVINSINNFTF